MDDILNRIKQFILEKRQFTNLVLDRETSIQNDLKIYGDDAVEFILAFGKEFKVDISEFEIREYFDSESDPITRSIIHLLRKKNKQKKNLSIGDLEVAAKKGKLI